jgi:small subunit ribosomal protein S9
MEELMSKISDEKIELKVAKNANYGTGKRKSSIARVWVFPGKGLFLINRYNSTFYLKRGILNDSVMKPLRLLNIEGKYNVFVTVSGGGLTGQAGACQLGLTRALMEMNGEFRKPLKEAGLVTRDARVKERKKYGRKKARKGYQFRKR